MRALALPLVLLLTSSCAIFPDSRDHGWMVVPSTNAPIRWQARDLPIDLLVHPSGVFWYQHVVKAAKIWNEWLGREAFRVGGDLRPDAVAYLESSPGVVPIFGFQVDPSCKVEVTTLCWPHTRTSAQETGQIEAVSMMLPLDLPLALTPDATWIVVHELGHVLGLDHDDQALDSLMVPSFAIPLISDPQVTRADLQRLTAWYFPGPEVVDER